MNAVVPDGAVPETTPLPAPTASHAGAPGASANVGAGTPDAVNAYEYRVPTVAVSGGAAAVNAGGADAGLTATVNGPAVALGLTPFEATTL